MQRRGSTESGKDLLSQGERQSGVKDCPSEPECSPEHAIQAGGSGRSAARKVILFANTDWYLYNFRRSLAQELKDRGVEVLLISPCGPYGLKLRELGFRWQGLPMDRASLNPLREVWLLVHLWRLFRRERAALVHNFTIKCAIYGSIAALLARVPARINAVAGMGYVFTSDDGKARLLRPLVRALMRLVLDGKNSRLILQNPDDVDLFEKARLVDVQKVRLILGSGVDTCQFSASSSAARGNARGSLRVLLSARLLWDKGVAEFVEAARLLHAEGRQIVFLLAGSPDPGNPAAIPNATLIKWVDEGVLTWLGHVDDMPALLASVDIMVLPSYREGLPKGLIEAAACALPLVTTDVPGCREVVTHEVDGLLVPVRDAAALACAIRRLFLDSELRDRLGRAAREKAVREFEVSSVNARTLEVYEELRALP